MSLARRYQLTKLWNAVEAGLHNLVVSRSPTVSSGAGGGFRGDGGEEKSPPPSSSSSSSSSSASNIDSSSNSSRSNASRSSDASSSRQQQGPASSSYHISSAIAKFKEAYNQQLTTVMYMAGTAMAPALNKAGLEDRDALEKLVVRAIPRPSARVVRVGDVVAFNSPLTLGVSSDTNEFVMVRRVAAMEGDEMVASTGSTPATAEESSSGQQQQEQQQELEGLGQVPEGHCWVLADNENLKPPEVCWGGGGVCMRLRSRVCVLRGKQWCLCCV